MLKKMLAVSLMMISVGGLMTACGDSGSDACSSDGDCKGDRICDGGECVSPDSDNSTSSNSTSSNSTSSNNTSPNNTTPNSTTPNNTTPNSTTPNNTTADGALGADCLDGAQCDSGYCREEAGAVGGVCAENDFGDMCQENSDCAYGACLYRDLENDAFGYCTATCESFTDCPTFWDCDEVGNAGGTYCIQN